MAHHDEGQGASATATFLPPSSSTSRAGSTPAYSATSVNGPAFRTTEGGEDSQPANATTPTAAAMMKAMARKY